VTAARELVWPLRVIVCFFAADAFERLVILAATFRAGYPLTETATLLDRYLPHALLLAFDVMLAVEIGRRTSAGRIWGAIYLAATALLGIALWVVEPERWVGLTTGGRLLALTTQVVNLAIIAVLLGRRSSKILVR